MDLFRWELSRREMVASLLLRSRRLRSQLQETKFQNSSFRSYGAALGGPLCLRRLSSRRSGCARATCRLGVRFCELAKQRDESTLEAEELCFVSRIKTQKLRHARSHGGQAVVDLAMSGERDQLFISPLVIGEKSQGEFGASADQGPYRGPFVAPPENRNRSKKNCDTGVIDHRMSFWADYSRQGFCGDFCKSIEDRHSHHLSLDLSYRLVAAHDCSSS